MTLRSGAHHPTSLSHIVIFTKDPLRGRCAVPPNGLQVHVTLGRLDVCPLVTVLRDTSAVTALSWALGIILTQAACANPVMGFVPLPR